jgi:hypothetical protein
MMLKIQPDTKTGSRAIMDGTLPKVIQETMAALKPECAYFYAEDGVRASIMIFDMADVTDIPAALEPLFQQLDARVSLTPVMTAEELAAGLEKAAR